MPLTKCREFLVSQIVFLVFVIVSFYLRHRGLSFFDASDFATPIEGAGIPHAPGYPLYVILGKVFYALVRDPFDAQFWLNILAAWTTCFFLFKTLASNKSSAILAVLFLLAQGLFQQYILIPEVFTLNLALVSALIYFHQRFEKDQQLRYVFAIGSIYGLAVCHHHLMALMVPASAFLLVRGFLKTCWWKGLGLAALGFALGLLPLSFFFFTTEQQPPYTYYSVRTLQDLLFVVLRRGYGTFKMTGSAQAVSSWDLLAVIFGGLFKSTFAVGLVGGIVAMPFYLRPKKPLRAEAILSISSIAIFIVAFCVMANFPIETTEGKNAFIRYLSFPGLLLLYPLSYGWELLALKYGQKIFWVGGALAILAGAYSFAHLNYRHYPVIDFQIEQAFKTIEREVGKNPDTDINPSYNRCVIFALTDPLHFGGRYYNEFKAKEHCYFYSVATVITGQFQAKNEQQLMVKILGADYPLAGQVREKVMIEFLTRAQRSGYRVFFVYPGDLQTFNRPELMMSPVGNILELKDANSRVPVQKLVDEYAKYLESLQELLSELEQAPVLPETVSASSAQAPFANLEIYGQLIKAPPTLQELERNVHERARKFLEHSR